VIRRHAGDVVDGCLADADVVELGSLAAGRSRLATRGDLHVTIDRAVEIRTLEGKPPVGRVLLFFLRVGEGDAKEENADDKECGFHGARGPRRTSPYPLHMNAS
jgi:hypothetical protein